MIAGLIAMLVGRGLSSLVANLIVWGVIAIGVVGALAWVHHEYDVRILEPARVQGDARTLKLLNGPKGEITVLKAQVGTLTQQRDAATKERDEARADLSTAQSTNVTLAANNKEFQAVNKTQAESIARWQTIAGHLKAANAAVQARLDAEIAKSTANIARLREEAKQPSTTVAAAQQKAKQILEELATWALQRQPG